MGREFESHRGRLFCDDPFISSYVTPNPLCGFSFHTLFEVSTLASLCVTPDQCQWMCPGGMWTQISDLSGNQIEPWVSFLLRQITYRYKYTNIQIRCIFGRSWFMG